jgi:hypothetical protein
MGVVNILQVQKVIAGIFEIGPDDNTFGVASADQGLIPPEAVIEHILVTDMEVREWIADSPKNGHRGTYLINSADIVASGSSVPPHAGKLGTIKIKLQSGAYVIGEEAPSISAFRQWQQNPTIWPVADVQGRYVIVDEDIIEFIGTAAQVKYVPLLTIDRATPACQAPEEYTGVVTRGTVASLQRAYNLALVSKAAGEYAEDEVAIKGGAKERPPFRVAA